MPADAVVVAGVFSGAFYSYDRWTVRWDRVDPARFAQLRDMVKRPWYAVISDTEVSHAEFLRHVPGNWTPVARNRDVTLYRLD